jgi:hypothetical protein
MSSGKMKNSTSAEPVNYGSNYTIPIKNNSSLRIPHSHSAFIHQHSKANTSEHSSDSFNTHKHHVHYTDEEDLEDGHVNMPSHPINSILKHSSSNSPKPNPKNSRLNHRLSDKEIELLKSTHRERRGSHIQVKLVPASTVYLESGHDHQLRRHFSHNNYDCAEFSDDNVSFSDSSFSDMTQLRPTLCKRTILKTVLATTYRKFKIFYYQKQPQ